MSADTMVSGFRATGIYPIDRDQVLKRLPGVNKEPGDDEMLPVLNDSILDLLKENLGIGPNAPPKKKKRGQKLSAGK